MTVEERMKHVYQPGDEARFTERVSWGTPCSFDAGDTITVVSDKGIYIVFDCGNHPRHAMKRYMEPVGRGARSCTCPVATLMTTGCTCGGH